jgi:hypothetical protein
MENSKIICRKCKGNHLTIKCGKDGANTIEKLMEVETPKHVDTTSEKTTYKTLDKTNTTDNTKSTYQTEDKPYVKREYTRDTKYGKAKMTNLPTDISEEELLELLFEWGTVKRLKVLNYKESSTAYIDFRNEEEVDYFIKRR